MKPTDRMECLSCGWKGAAWELQASPMDIEEKACLQCKSIAVEKINPRQRSKLL